MFDLTPAMTAVVAYFSGPLGQLELLATLLLIANVYLLAKEKLVNYYFGAAGVAIYGYLFYEYQLYSDMLLQWVFFLPLQVFGFFYWKYGHKWATVSHYTSNRDTDRLNVITLPREWYFHLIIIGAAFTFALGSYMDNNTDASFPYWDALTTIMSVVASILLLRKYLENWIIWIAMDCIAIPIYYAKEMYVTSGLYVVFLGLASYGLYTWWYSRDLDRSMTRLFQGIR